MEAIGPSGMISIGSEGLAWAIGLECDRDAFVQPVGPPVSARKRGADVDQLMHGFMDGDLGSPGRLFAGQLRSSVVDLPLGFVDAIGRGAGLVCGVNLGLRLGN